MEDNKNNQSQNPAVSAQSGKTTKVIKKKIISGYGSYGGYGGYGGGYGGYGYGGYGSYGSYGSYYGAYGAGHQLNGDSNVANRTFRDYMMILRERFWYIVVTFFIIFAGVLLYTFRVTPIFTSVASIQILRDADNPIEGPGSADRSMNNRVLSTEDFNTQVKLLESFEIVRAVKSRMKEDELKRFMTPYHNMFTFDVPKTEEELLMENRQIIPERMSLIIRIVFSHPDKEVAANIANLFAEEFIAYTFNGRVQKLMKSVDELRAKVAQQGTKLKDLDKKMVEYREKNGVSLDVMSDVISRELQEISSILVNDKRVFDNCSVQWNLVQQYKREGKDLCNLQFIADTPIVSKLISTRSDLQLSLATLEKRYKEKHPTMISTRKAIEENAAQLAGALDSEYSKIKATYDNAKEVYEQSVKRMEEKNKEKIALGKKAVVYNGMIREKEVAESMHASLKSSLEVRTAQVNLLNEGANIVDRAGPSPRPSNPKYILNIIAGLFAGLLGGVGMAFLVAFLDDRAKSSYDIEAIIGLPLLGVIPRIKRLNSSEKAQVAASGADRATTEAFRSMHSTLKINNLSKNAKVVLFTSTTPSEGKSFVVSNLAYTCALNGEKTIVIDADLRLPALAKILGIHSDKGLIGYVEEGKSLDDAIIRDSFPNLDILICEKRAKNPTQTLNSAEFISMIAQFREKYDRIFIDSPPIGAVSDAISLLPSVDGVIYVVKFNTVKRKTIRNYVRRMMESNVPVLGAVMNMVNPGSASVYSMNYYDKSYQNYYTTPPEMEEVEEEVLPTEEDAPKSE